MSTDDTPTPRIVIGIAKGDDQRLIMKQPTMTDMIVGIYGDLDTFYSTTLHGADEGASPGDA